MNDFSREYFDKVNSKIGEYSSYSLERFREPFNILSQQIISLIAPKKILDIGCAKGFLVSFFRTKGVEAFGVDISEYAINESSNTIRPFLHKVDLNREVLPFPKSSFDCVVCMGTLEYVEEQDYLLEEIKRVITEKGTILITTINDTPINDKLRIYTRNPNEWDSLFIKNGFVSNHNLSQKIFIDYIQEINKYDICKNENPDFKTKRIFALFIYKIGFGALLGYYLYRKQLRSGYSVLCYQRV